MGYHFFFFEMDQQSQLTHRQHCPIVAWTHLTAPTVSHRTNKAPCSCVIWYILRRSWDTGDFEGRSELGMRDSYFGKLSRSSGVWTGISSRLPFSTCLPVGFRWVRIWQRPTGVTSHMIFHVGTNSGLQWSLEGCSDHQPDCTFTQITPRWNPAICD